MTPAQFLDRLKKQGPKAVYLFIGPDGFERDRCRRAVTEAALPDIAEREEGYVRHDLAETDLARVIDDAMSFSLFASRRLLWVAGAEAALPRRLTAAEADSGNAALLKNLVERAAPGVTVVFDSSRYDFDGEDKAKLDRVTKFYQAIPDVVEFPRFSTDAARTLVQQRARELDLKIAAAEVDFLVEACGADASRLANELEKLSLCAGPGGVVTEELITELVPNARVANIFSLVASLGRGDRRQSLDLLDTLVREGEYLPLALTFVGTQLRLALTAQEAKLANAFQIQSHFQKLGVPMWKSRAEQVAQTVTAFPAARLRKAVVDVFETDRLLRDINPDDRVVMERLVWQLTR